MNVRVVAAVVVTLVVGAAGGFALARDRQPVPVARESFATPEPMPAADPAYPVIEYDVLPDPTTAPLSTSLSLRTARFEDEGTVMTAPVPVGWFRGDVLGPSWNFSLLANPENTYLLRIGILTATLQDVRVVRDARISALQATEDDDNLDNLDVEEVTDTGFVASYIQNGFQRVNIERFLTMPGSGTDVGPAFATVSMTGREIDRPGMAALLARITAELAVVQRP